MPDHRQTPKLNLGVIQGSIQKRPEHNIVWLLSGRARQEVQTLKRQLGAAYHSHVEALREHLQHYFLAVDGCRAKTTTIFPIGSSPDGAKRFKVRWFSPSGGKSGGLRLAISAYCERQLVRVHAIFARKDDPDDGDFDRAFFE